MILPIFIGLVILNLFLLFSFGEVSLFIPANLLAVVADLATIAAIGIAVCEYIRRKNEISRRLTNIKSHIEREIKKREETYQEMYQTALESDLNNDAECKKNANIIKNILGVLPKDTYSSLLNSGYLVEGYPEGSQKVIDYYTECQFMNSIIFLESINLDHQRYINLVRDILRFLSLYSKEVLGKAIQEELSELKAFRSKFYS